MNKADILAQKRTELAFERTLLSYIRTGIMFLSVGIAIVQMNALKEIFYLGGVLLGVSPLFIIYGFIQYRKSKVFIEKLMKE